MKILFWLYDLEEIVQSFLDYEAVRHRNIYICQKCGVMSAPFLGKIVGPRAGGWKKVNEGYVCHFCDYHFDYSSQKEIDERMEYVKAENEDTRLKITLWQVNYPWAKIHYK